MHMSQGLQPLPRLFLFPLHIPFSRVFMDADCSFWTRFTLKFKSSNREGKYLHFFKHTIGHYVIPCFYVICCLVWATVYVNIV